MTKILFFTLQIDQKATQKSTRKRIKMSGVSETPFFRIGGSWGDHKMDHQNGQRGVPYQYEVPIYSFLGGISFIRLRFMCIYVFFRAGKSTQSLDLSPKTVFRIRGHTRWGFRRSFSDPHKSQKPAGQIFLRPKICFH